MDRPTPRGDLSRRLIDALWEGGELARTPDVDVEEPLRDEDLQLALHLCYELHYRGFSGVDPRFEWDPDTLAFRAGLEAAFERALLDAVGPRTPWTGAEHLDVSRALVELAQAEAGASLSRYLSRDADVDMFREFVIHRSIYTLKEADPHSFVIARLEGPPKAALVEIEFDEYGGGRPERIHAAIFARTMEALGLDHRHGAYLDAVPAVTLATSNLVSLFSLHRRLRGAAMGHLALFELTSSVPNHRYGNGLRRLGFGTDATHYYDEHVVADSIHDMIATYDLIGSLVQAEPELVDDVLFGAEALAFLEGRFATHLLEAWNGGRTSLRDPAPISH
jgi:hypothetical protein